jgi:hypothetical protein
MSLSSILIVWTFEQGATSGCVASRGTGEQGCSSRISMLRVRIPRSGSDQRSAVMTGTAIHLT